MDGPSSLIRQLDELKADSLNFPLLDGSLVYNWPTHLFHNADFYVIFAQGIFVMVCSFCYVFAVFQFYLFSFLCFFVFLISSIPFSVILPVLGSLTSFWLCNLPFFFFKIYSFKLVQFINVCTNNL